VTDAIPDRGELSDARCGRLRVRLGDARRDGDQIVRLRSATMGSELGLDAGLDRLDRHARHLVAEVDGEVVGAYRVLFGRLSEGGAHLSCADEFVLDDLGLDLDRVAEVSRLCIHPGHRGQVVLGCLMAGLDWLVGRCELTHLLGCCSVFGAGDHEIEHAVRTLRARGVVEGSRRVRPRAGYLLRNAPPTGASKSLLDAYLKAGCRVVPEPAYDPEWRCHDLFIVLEYERRSEWVKAMTGRFRRAPAPVAA
jgi:putative hemolysin